MGVEINCPACGESTLLIREPVYEGFAKTGDRLSCSGCGHVFDDESEVPYKEKETLRIFDESDRSQDPDVFKGDDVRFCRLCRHYVVNPFMQWCGLHKKEVAATDTCPKFTPKTEDDSSSSPL